MSEKYFSRDNLELVIDGLKTEMVPNWNENDSGALGYINNRTHYEEITELFSIENAEFTNGQYVNGTAFTINVGDTYIVNWDGIKYTCVACEFNGLPAIGNTSFLDGKGTGEPFFIGYYNEENVNFIAALNDSTDGSTTTHTLSIVGNLVHTINPKYLPKLVGKDVTGVEYIVNGETLIAGAGAEIFNYCCNIAIGNYSHAEGSETTASGDISHAEGSETTASGTFSHAEGFDTTADAQSSHAEGSETAASGACSHAEGSNTAVANSNSVTATTTTVNSKGYAGHAEGYGTVSYGRCSHAEGNGTTASGYDSHAEGYKTTASGDISHAEGNGAKASGMYSHAEGNGTIASGSNSHAEGAGATASGNTSHAEGAATTASGVDSHAEGNSTKAATSSSHAEGKNTIVGENRVRKLTDSSLSGYAGHAEGYGTVSYGRCSHAEGNGTKASGYDSHAEGYSTTASGVASHAEGNGAEASNESSHAEGYNTTASGKYSHAEGSGTTASGGFGSHAEGCITTASGSHGSHAEGHYTTASGRYSHAEGHYTTASCDAQHVQGKWNIEDTNSTYAHIVGNGVANTLSNAHTLDWDGNAWFAGDVYVGSTSGTNKDEGSKKLVTESEVDAKIADLVNSAPEKLNTLDELAAALGNDENFATTVTNQIATKQDKLTGNQGQVIGFDANGNAIAQDATDGGSTITIKTWTAADMI